MTAFRQKGRRVKSPHAPDGVLEAELFQQRLAARALQRLHSVEIGNDEQLFGDLVQIARNLARVKELDERIDDGRILLLHLQLSKAGVAGRRGGGLANGRLDDRVGHHTLEDGAAGGEDEAMRVNARLADDDGHVGGFGRVGERREVADEGVEDVVLELGRKCRISGGGGAATAG